jgi:predicted phage terminase large subunit-like protein
MTVTLPTGWRSNVHTASATLDQLRAARDRRIPMPVWDSPGALAAAIDPTTVETPALALIDQALMWAHTTPDARLIISMPPQEGKSQRATKTATLWALTRNPESRIGIVSYATDLAAGFGRDIRNWITTNDGTDGSLDLRLRIAPDNGAAARWSLAGHRGGVTCVGIGAGLTGRPIDALVIDDPFADAEQATSETYRKKVWEWWQAVGATRLAPGAPVIVILTRWHEDDLAGRLLAAEDKAQWRVINIPALADHDPEKGHLDPLGREPGQWLTSARGRTTDQWEAIRIRSGARVFSALYQGQPAPDTGNVWQRGWWRRYDTPMWSATDDALARTVDCDEMILSWDMTFKDTKSSDYVVGQVWARRGANVYLLEQVRARLTFTETLAAFKAMAKRWPQATAKLVEDKANGTAVIDTLKSKIPGIVPITPTESKYARANAVAPFIEAGNVILPTVNVALFDIEQFVDEAAAFPNATHDDQVDAASQAITRLLADGAGASAWTSYIKRQVAAAAAEQQAAAATAVADVDPLTAARNTAHRLHQHR